MCVLKWLYTYLVERLVADVLSAVGVKNTVHRVRSGDSIQLSRLFQLGWRRRRWQLFLHSRVIVSRLLQQGSDSVAHVIIGPTRTRKSQSGNANFSLHG